MIAPLRRRHRLIFGALALSLPALLGAALLSRPPMKDDEGFGFLFETQLKMGENGYPMSWEEAGLKLQMTYDEQGAGVEVTPVGPTRMPDPLLYWSASRATADLPADARLIGPVPTLPHQTFRLPSNAGQLILYSVGHGLVVSQFTLPGSETP